MAAATRAAAGCSESPAISVKVSRASGDRCRAKAILARYVKQNRQPITAWRAEAFKELQRQHDIAADSRMTWGGCCGLRPKRLRWCARLCGERHECRIADAHLAKAA